MTRLLLRFALFCGGACLLLAGAGVMVGALTPRDQIALSLNTGTLDSELLLVDLHGNRAFPLHRHTDGMSGFGALAWSPDGETLAFAAFDSRRQQTGIYTLRLRDMHLTHQADSGFTPVWSPDGTRIAYPMRLPTAMAIVVVERDAPPDSWELLASFDLIHQINGLDWSSDGRTILFATDATLLRLDLASGYTTPVIIEQVAYPRLSPDGQQIAYLRRAGFAEWALFVADMDSRDEFALTEDGLVRATHAGAWSPDGTRIAFTSTGGDIYTVGLRGGDLSLLYPISVIDSPLGLDWRPR